MQGRLYFFLAALFIGQACGSTQKKENGQITKAASSEAGASENPALAAAEDSDNDGETPVYDPLEGYNRKIHSFNDFFFHYCLYPLGKGWNFITPKFMRVGLDNFITWAYTPGRLVNNLLQAKFAGAGREIVSFSVNATMGGLGVYDASKDIFGLERTNEDTDQTLGRWGFGEGAYIVWPFIGPRTIRGTFGFAGDVSLQPQMVIVPVYIKPETIWAQRQSLPEHIQSGQSTVSRWILMNMII